MMNLIKKAILTFFMVISLGAASVAVAENAAAAEVIAHIEQALVEVGKGDFNMAHNHLKEARNASDRIEGHEATVKQGYQSLIQSQILGKSANPEKTTAELNKALGFYKSL